MYDFKHPVYMIRNFKRHNCSRNKGQDQTHLVLAIPFLHIFRDHEACLGLFEFYFLFVSYFTLEISSNPQLPQVLFMQHFSNMLLRLFLPMQLSKQKANSY